MSTIIKKERFIFGIRSLAVTFVPVKMEERV